MPKFSQKSLTALANCHSSLRKIAFEAIEHIDFTVLCGFRSELEQNEAYTRGNSKLRWPRSMHNVMPSAAMDLAPYPIDWNNLKRFEDLAGVILDIAEANKTPITWGGNWATFRDYPHFELRI